MVALGKVRGNLMIDLHTTSAKLRDRASASGRRVGTVRLRFRAHNA